METVIALQIAGIAAGAVTIARAPAPVQASANATVLTPLLTCVIATVWFQRAMPMIARARARVIAIAIAIALASAIAIAIAGLTPPVALVVHGVIINMEKFDLKLGFSCNHSCVHCAVKDSTGYPDLTFDKIRELILSIPDEIPIVITGGEPTCRTDIVDILKLCKNKKMLFFTNGSLLTKAILEELKKLNAKVLLAFQSVDKKVYAETAKGPDFSYNAAINASKDMVKLGISFIWTIVLHRLTKDTVLRTLSAAKLIDKRLIIKLIYPDITGGADDKSLLSSYSELASVISEAIANFPKSLDFDGFPLCIVKDHKDYILRCEKKKTATD
jgi:organic radical activating enzyme